MSLSTRITKNSKEIIDKCLCASFLSILYDLITPIGAPQIAGNKAGDCTFEVDECGWTNPSPRDRVDTVDFVRTVASESRAPLSDHTIGTPQGE